MLVVPQIVLLRVYKLPVYRLTIKKVSAIRTPTVEKFFLKNAPRHGGSSFREAVGYNWEPMPFLIDGHNLIGQLPGLSLADPEDEASLVMLLRRFAASQRKHKVCVIFDGGVYGHPANLKGYGVEVHFVKAPADADSELIRRIRAIKQRDAWIVVSSDRAVAGAARAHGLTVESAQTFARRLAARDVPAARPDAKPGDRPLSPAEVEAWRRVFEPEANDDPATDPPPSHRV